MTHFPPALVHEKRRKILRYIGMALSALMVLTMLMILALIVRSEREYDEAKCRFAKLSERDFADGRVLEEQRSCVETVSERRYLVARTGKPAYELARKRLSSARFAPHRYRWKLTSDAQGRLVLTVLVDGKVSSEFREEDAVHP